MKRIQTILSKLLILSILLCVESIHASKKVDVYLLYTGDQKALKNEIKAALPKSIKVKHYNVSLLLIADYSGKQKVTTKLSAARLIVFVGDKTGKFLDSKNFSRVITVYNSTEKDIQAIMDALKL